MTSAASAVTTATKNRRTPVALRLVLIPFAIAVFVKIVGSFLFAFSTGTLEGTVVGVVLIAVGLLYVFLMLRIHRGEPVIWRTAVWLVGADILWSVYKVFIYGEAESRPILAAAVLSLVLLLAPSARAFVRDER